jgi:hypothetical protein
MMQDLIFNFPDLDRLEGYSPVCFSCPTFFFITLEPRVE